MEHLNLTSVRGEFKLAIYTRYLLPSMRLYLTVQTLNKTHLQDLDDISRMYIKKWLNYPKHGVSDIGLYHPLGMGIKKPSQIYMEGHVMSYINSKEKADADVEHALNNRLHREFTLKKKLSTITVADDIYKKANLKLNLTNDIQISNHQNPDETPHANTFKCNKCKHASDQKNDLKTHVYLDHQLRQIN